jgi:hypothetical protein
MLPVSLVCRFVFLHLVYPYVSSALSFFFSLLKNKRQSRETGNIGGTQDEDKQNDNPEAT